MSTASAPTSTRAPYRVPFAVPEFPFEEAVVRAADTGTIPGDAGPLLETVVEMLDELERPDAHMDCIQVAGTNGKTSTARFCAAALAGEGLRCALYTSPQLVRYPERMEVDGAPIADAAFAHGISAALEAGRRVNARRAAAGEDTYTITPFDLLTVAALVAFAEEAVDVAVLEVGLGGRWDATSATEPVAVAVTGIGLDHMRILGSTLAEIAGEKAAIIKPGRAVVLGEGTHEPSVEAVMAARCREAGATPIVVSHEVLHVPERLGDELRIRVPGTHAAYEVGAPKPAYQGQNIACAVLLAEAYLGRALDAASLAARIASCPTPGRFDVLRRDPLLLVDACHNPQSCENFVASLDELAPAREGRPTALIAALSDKDVAGILRVLAPAFPAFAVTATASDRALPADELARLLREELAREGRADAEVSVHPTVAAALDAFSAAGRPLVAAGTITLAGEVAGLVRG